jgi:hypothetical protein
LFLEQHDAVASSSSSVSGVAAAGDAVTVMSIHAAKGLEFPVVVLAGCGKRHNLRDSNNRVIVDAEHGLAVQAVDRRKEIRYPSPQWLVASEGQKRATLAEELRLLYVAMTRAREHLVCVGHMNKAADGVESRPTTEEPLADHPVLSGGSFVGWLLSVVGHLPLFQVEAIGALEQESRREEVAKVPEPILARAALTEDPAPPLRRIQPLATDLTRAAKPAARQIASGGPSLKLQRQLAAVDWCNGSTEDEPIARWILSTEPVALAREHEGEIRVNVPLLWSSRRTGLMRRATLPLLVVFPRLNHTTISVDIGSVVGPWTRRRARRLAVMTSRVTRQPSSGFLLTIDDRRTTHLGVFKPGRVS